MVSTSPLIPSCGRLLVRVPIRLELSEYTDHDWYQCSYWFHTFCSLTRSRHLYIFSFKSPLLSRFNFLTITRSGCLAEIRPLVCISRSQRNSCILFCSKGLSIQLVHMAVFSCIDFFPLIFSICLFYDWWFHIYHYIACIFSFVSLVYICFQVVCHHDVVVGLVDEIQFISQGFPFLAMSKSSSVSFACQLLQMSIRLFFSTFFSIYFCSVVLCFLYCF